MLAKAIADYAFRNYNIIKELLAIEPPEGEIYYLRQYDNVLNKPFFYVISISEIEKADTFSRRLKELNIRTGYLRCLTIYDFRTEGLYFINIFLFSSLFILILKLIRRI